jgi:aldose 1-epimerase
MKYTISDFGALQNGHIVKLYSFESKDGMKVKITNYGGIITSIEVPDKNGNCEEITAGFPTFESYLKEHPNFGVIIGRYANRIANGRFLIFGKEYSLQINSGPNHLHGGNGGFQTKVWTPEIALNKDNAALKLSYISPHQEEGYPGNLKVSVTYTITDNNAIHITFYAKTDAHTHVNLTNHCYFNLSGFKENVYSHKLWLNANSFIAVNENLIPTGEFLPCENTWLDFTVPVSLGERINEKAGGLDHCFALDHPAISKAAAVLSHEKSGRRMTVYCTQPGIQIYTANSLDGSLCGHNKTAYNQHSAVCLETQHFPDTPNHCNFPPTLLTPGETYFHETKLVFGLNEG